MSFSTLLIVAALAGVGGGNFSSSMANIDASTRSASRAGRSASTPAAATSASPPCSSSASPCSPRPARTTLGVILAVYLPLIVVATPLRRAGAWTTSRHVPQRAAGRCATSPASRHAWVMSLLYIGTFGSFIGFGFAFGQVLQVQFADDFDTPIKAAYLTFLGPLLGSLVRPVGGRLADRLGGARVTFWTFVAMAVGAGSCWSRRSTSSLPLFLVGFIALFVLTGLGNGSTYKMIPAIFRAKARTAVAGGAADADDRASATPAACRGR